MQRRKFGAWIRDNGPTWFTVDNVSGDAMNKNIMVNFKVNSNRNVGTNVNMINGQRQSPRPKGSMGMTADISSQLGLLPTGQQHRQKMGQDGMNMNIGGGGMGIRS